jgi:putative oxidoreductase
MTFLNHTMASFMGMLASIAEVCIGGLFLIGYQIRWAAICAFLLTLTFALCMAFFMSYKAPFSYSVYADSAGCLLLATIPVYRWSIDSYLAKKNIKHIFSN